jgi:hypothetical protein
MPTLSHNNPFQSWEFTPQELTAGTILTTIQKQCIQNQISSLALQRINLMYDPSTPLVFVQRDAELKGQINALQYLIELSVAAEAEYSNPSQE